jgi:hypothetical protein
MLALPASEEGAYTPLSLSWRASSCSIVSIVVVIVKVFARLTNSPSSSDTAEISDGRERSKSEGQRFLASTAFDYARSAKKGSRFAVVELEDGAGA